MTISQHAWVRMQQRRCTADDIDLAFFYGRTIYQNSGSIVFRIGRKEIAKHRHQIDLTRLDGLHVVCTTDHYVITVYRNAALREKDLIPRRRRKKRRDRRVPQRPPSV